MANPIYVQPDPVLAVIEYLRDTAEVTALIPANKIVSSIPASNTSYPYIIIQWAGGSGIWPGIDEASVQVDVIGGSKPDCQKIARTVRAAIWAIANDSTSEATLVSGADEVAPQWFPDTVPTPPLSRYTARYRVLLHP